MRTQALVNAAVGAPFVLTDIELDDPEPNGELHAVLPAFEIEFPSHANASSGNKRSLYG
jgi:hypothetical protein